MPLDNTLEDYRAKHDLRRSPEPSVEKVVNVAERAGRAIRVAQLRPNGVVKGCRDSARFCALEVGEPQRDGARRTHPQ